METGHDLAMRLRAAYLALHRRTNADCARRGLTADQFVLLTTLTEGDAATQKELVERTGSDPNTMSEMLSRLERRGLILREQSITDRRARSVTLTPRGRQLQAAMWADSAAIRVRLVSLCSPDEREILIRNLDRIAFVMAAKDEPE